MLPKQDTNIKQKRGKAIRDAILKVLRVSDFGLTASELSTHEGVDVSRPTAVKYLQKMLDENIILSRPVGSYTLYYTKKVTEDPSNTLYLTLLGELAKFLPGELDMDRVIRFVHKAGRRMAMGMELPSEIELESYFEAEEDFSVLKGIAQVVEVFLNYFFKSEKGQNVEIVKPLGQSTPRSLLLRIINPFGVDTKSELHFHFIAKAIEEKVKYLTRLPIYLSNPDIRPEAVYFELGFVEKYFFDISVVEHAPGVKSKYLLDRCKNWLMAAMSLDFEEFTDPENRRLHYKFTVDVNRDLEAFFENIAHALHENKALAQELGLRPTREWHPYEDWPDQEYAQIEFIANFEYLFDYFEEVSRQVYPYASYCIHIERTNKGFLMYFMEELDYRVLTTSTNSFAELRNIYNEFGVDSEEFFRRRQEQVITFQKRLANQRRDERARRRRARSKRALWSPHWFVISV